MTRIDWSRELSLYRCEAICEGTKDRCLLPARWSRDRRRVCHRHFHSGFVRYPERPASRRLR